MKRQEFQRTCSMAVLRLQMLGANSTSVTRFDGLSEDSHINCPLRARPITALYDDL